MSINLLTVIKRRVTLILEQTNLQLTVIEVICQMLGYHIVLQS